MYEIRVDLLKASNFGDSMKLRMTDANVPLLIFGESLFGGISNSLQFVHRDVRGMLQIFHHFLPAPKSLAANFAGRRQVTLPYPVLNRQFRNAKVLSQQGNILKWWGVGELLRHIHTEIVLGEVFDIVLLLPLLDTIANNTTASGRCQDFSISRCTSTWTECIFLLAISTKYFYIFVHMPHYLGQRKKYVSASC